MLSALCIQRMLFALAVALMVAFAEGTLFFLAQMRRDSDKKIDSSPRESTGGHRKSEPVVKAVTEEVTVTASGDAKYHSPGTLRQRTRRHPSLSDPSPPPVAL
jgi:hypothetical protein